MSGKKITEYFKHVSILDLFFITLSFLILSIIDLNYIFLLIENYSPLGLVINIIFCSSYFFLAIVSFLIIMFSNKLHDIVKKILLSCTIFIPILYLILIIILYDKYWPSIPGWVATFEIFLYTHAIFLMLTSMYCIIKVALYKSVKKLLKEYIFCGVSIVIVPLFYYIVAKTLSSFYYRINYQIYILLFVITVFLSIFIIGVFFRLIYLLYNNVIKNNKIALKITLIITTTILPFCGLLLNRNIAFPADYSESIWYVLAILNGIVLILPDFKNKYISLCMLGLKSLFYPFTLYFFLVFVPFTPLAIPAIIALGSGFLILSPSLLFLMHTLVLKKNYLDAVLSFKKSKVVLCLILSMLILPSSFIIKSFYDKALINNVIEYVYETDYTKPLPPCQDVNGSLAVINNLSQMKNGSFIPFLSNLYNSIVFNNLVLPDSKINYIHKMLSGTNIPPQKNNFINIFNNLNINRFRDSSLNLEISDTVTISNIIRTTKIEEDTIYTEAVIDISNTENHVMEFISNINLSDGVYITDFKLLAGTTWLQGKIFEKKAALWVYESIINTRKDPGIIYFVDRNKLMLRVFPFGSKETRKISITFMHHKRLKPEVTINGEQIIQQLSFNDNSASINPLLIDANNNYGSLLKAVLIPANSKKNLVATTLPKIVYEVVLDRSSNGYNIEEIKKLSSDLKNYLKANDTINYNYGSYYLKPCKIMTDGTPDFATLDSEFPMGGSLCTDRILKNIYASYFTRDTLPIVIFLTKGTSILHDEKLKYFSALKSEVNYYLIGSDTHNLKKIIINDTNDINETEYASIMIEGKKVYVPLNEKDTLLFVPIKSTLITNTSTKDGYHNDAYRNALEMSSLYIEQNIGFKGSIDLRKILLNVSKTSGIMNENTAYIAVENPLHLKVLENTEAQTKGAKEALELGESPTPEIYLLAFVCVICLSLIIFIKKRSRKIIM